MDYKFYGWNTPEVKPINKKYNKIKNQRDLYDILSTIWCKDTCAPRMQDRWTSDNKTLGQCSITAFLVQDIFGGDVYGVRLDDGNYHCYNIVNGIKFDLTSEQFDHELIYDDKYEQKRDVHFSKLEKYERYKYLSKKLDEYLDGSEEL
jgi:hypothetical protein